MRMCKLGPSDFCDAGRGSFCCVRRTPGISHQGRDAVCGPLGRLGKGQREIARLLAGGSGYVSAAPVSLAGAGQPRCLGACQLVSRPQSRSGCRPRARGGSKESAGFPDLSGVSMDCRLLRFCGHRSNGHNPRYQIECRNFQYRDLGRWHMAPKREFGARGKCPSHHRQQLRGIVSGGHRNCPRSTDPQPARFRSLSRRSFPIGRFKPPRHRPTSP